jgi:hypothetical protein
MLNQFLSELGGVAALKSVGKWKTKIFQADAEDVAQHGLILNNTYKLWVCQVDHTSKSGTAKQKGQWSLEEIK